MGEAPRGVRRHTSLLLPLSGKAAQVYVAGGARSGARGSAPPLRPCCAPTPRARRVPQRRTPPVTPIFSSRCSRHPVVRREARRHGQVRREQPCLGCACHNNVLRGPAASSQEVCMCVLCLCVEAGGPPMGAPPPRPPMGAPMAPRPGMAPPGSMPPPGAPGGARPMMGMAPPGGAPPRPSARETAVTHPAHRGLAPCAVRRACLHVVAP